MANTEDLLPPESGSTGAAKSSLKLWEIPIALGFAALLLSVIWFAVVLEIGMLMVALAWVTWKVTSQVLRLLAVRLAERRQSNRAMT